MLQSVVILALLCQGARAKDSGLYGSLCGSLEWCKGECMGNSHMLLSSQWTARLQLILPRLQPWLGMLLEKDPRGMMHVSSSPNLPANNLSNLPIELQKDVTENDDVVQFRLHGF